MTVTAKIVSGSPAINLTVLVFNMRKLKVVLILEAAFSKGKNLWMEGKLQYTHKKKPKPLLPRDPENNVFLIEIQPARMK